VSFLLVSPQPAKPQAAFGNPAFIHAEVAADSLIDLRGCLRQVIGGPALPVGLQGERQGLLGFCFQAIRADPDFFGDRI
jgi:hypothetical protein